MTQQNCFWTLSAPPSRTYLDKPLPGMIDIVVIGGGFTGTSAALQLARGGVRVALLEAQHIGWGASARNGGQALSCLHHTLADSIKIHGRERAKEMFLAAVQAADTVEQIVREENLDCDYLRCGNIEAASKSAHFEALKKEQETLHEVANYEVQILPKSEIENELGTRSYYGVMINPRSGSVQPAKFVQGLAFAAERAGADIHEGTRVLGIDRVADSALRDGIRFKVRTERGVVAAKEVFLAANAWAGQVAPQFRQRVFPVESYMIATEPLPQELAQKLIPHNRVAYDTKKLCAYYRLSPDGRMVWGGEATFTGARPQMNIQALRRGMTDVFPELANIKIDYFWNGTLGVTFDENTHAGQMDGMWYSMCYVGHGVSLGTYMGQQIANEILGRPGNNPFANLNIPRIPLFQDKVWSANFAKLWYAILDKAG